MTIENTPFLRRVLVLDGAAGLGAGLAMLVGAPLLSSLLGLPQGLLFWAGIALLGCAAFIATFAFRPTVARMMLFDIALINALWAVASIAALLLGLVSANWLGTAFVVAQALLVAGFSAIQFGALRQAAPAAV